MSGPGPVGTSPDDYAEVALGDLVARYDALRLGADLDPGVGAVPARDRAGRALQELALGTAIAGRVQAGWALDAEAARAWRGRSRPAGSAGTGAAAMARDPDGPAR